MWQILIIFGWNGRILMHDFFCFLFVCLFFVLFVFVFVWIFLFVCFFLERHALQPVNCSIRKRNSPLCCWPYPYLWCHWNVQSNELQQRIIRIWESYVLFFFFFFLVLNKQDYQNLIVNILAEMTTTQATMARSLDQMVGNLPGRTLTLQCYRLQSYTVLYLSRSIKFSPDLWRALT